MQFPYLLSTNCLSLANLPIHLTVMVKHFTSRGKKPPKQARCKSDHGAFAI